MFSTLASKSKKPRKACFLHPKDAALDKSLYDYVQELKRSVYLLPAACLENQQLSHRDGPCHADNSTNNKE